MKLLLLEIFILISIWKIFIKDFIYNNIYKNIIFKLEIKIRSLEKISNIALKAK